MAGDVKKNVLTFIGVWATNAYFYNRDIVYPFIFFAIICTSRGVP